MFQNNNQQGGYANNSYQQRPPPINTQQQQSNLRQGKFLSPSNNTNAAIAMMSPPGSNNYYQHSPNTAQSTVHFEEEEESSHDGGRLDIPSFMFEECEFSLDESSTSKNSLDSDADKAGGSLPHHHNFQTTQSGNRKESEDDEAIIPSEVQLTLLCLDYLRDLRRSYALHPDGTFYLYTFVFIKFAMVFEHIICLNLHQFLSLSHIYIYYSYINIRSTQRRGIKSRLHCISSMEFKPCICETKQVINAYYL